MTFFTQSVRSSVWFGLFFHLRSIERFHLVQDIEMHFFACYIVYSLGVIS